jgi:hypothetical protein
MVDVGSLAMDAPQVRKVALRRFAFPAEYGLRSTGQAVEQQDPENLAALTTSDVVHLCFAE